MQSNKSKSRLLEFSITERKILTQMFSVTKHKQRPYNVNKIYVSRNKWGFYLLTKNNNSWPTVSKNMSRRGVTISRILCDKIFFGYIGHVWGTAQSVIFFHMLICLFDEAF